MKSMTSKLIVARSILVSTIMTSLIVCYTTASASTVPTEALNYFSSDYHESRNKFIVAARNNGGHIDSYQNPITGPEGKPLFIDVASFGASYPEAILVLGSGTHGVEGFAGSAIQTGLLRQGIVSTLATHTGLIMIHAINPFGVAHLRRVNEDNVDLNRNFIDHSKTYPTNDGYEQLADAIAPESISVWNNAILRIKLLWYTLFHGKLELQRAISSGQYAHPNGLFYGGHFNVWSNKIIMEIANRHFSNAKRVVVIDFHTGLGKYGKAEVIMNVPKKSPAYQRAAQWREDIVRTTVTGESVSTHVSGPLKLAFPEMLPNSEVTAVSLEFGTLPPKEVFWTLRAENWLHHYGGTEHPDSKRIKNELLRAFYPDDKEWKLDVWRQGNEIVRKALEQLQPN